MKKFIFTMITLLGLSASSQAMSYEQARQQALFLADKMAYELNLTEDQYEACYEVNLDYFMGINSQVDLYGDYWTRRNLDLSYILVDWQYRMFLDAAYFYRPLYWADGFWHFGIYARYPHRDYFYFGRPVFYDVYHGGHAWRMNGGKSWYHGRDFGMHGTRNHKGMRDGFNNGHYGRGGDIHKESGANHRGNNMRHGGQSSTRSTVSSRSGFTERTRENAGVQRGSANSRSNQVFGGNGTSSTHRTQTQQSNKSGFSSGMQRGSSSAQRSMSSGSTRSSMSRGTQTRSSSGPLASRSMSGSSSHNGSSHAGSSHSGGSHGGSRGGSFGGGRH